MPVPAPGPVVAGDGHVVIVVWAVPGAQQTEVVGIHGDAFRIRVAQPAERGRANEALRALLEAQLKAPVELVSGITARRKTFRVSGLSAGAVRRRLGV